MDTRVKPAHDGLTRVNPSLTLFAKFVSVGTTPYRGFAADVVISASPPVECGVMRNIMIYAAFIAGLGTIMAQMADKMAATPAFASTVARNAAPDETVARAGVRSITLPRDG